MCYHSQGGFTHSEVYNMPVYLRNFYLKELEDAKEKEQKAYDKANKSSTNVSRANIPT